MLKSKRKIVTFTVIMMVFSVFISYNVFIRSNEALALSKYGSRGEEVRQIQTKLKRWGYYKGNIDGIYGTQTLEAVKWFQSKNNLTVDGIAGKNTLQAMGIYNSSSSSGDSVSTSTNDVNLLARVIYGEARGEPYTGQVAIGAVVLNRVRSSSFPNTIAGVLYQPGAFTALVDGQFSLEPEESAKRAAVDAMNGWDPSGGAIYYYNPEKSTSEWIFTRETIAVIGSHVFAK